VPFGLATIGFAFNLHPQFFSLQFVSNIYGVGNGGFGIPLRFS
jgi:hypothetical protein